MGVALDAVRAVAARRDLALRQLELLGARGERVVLRGERGLGAAERVGAARHARLLVGERLVGGGAGLERLGARGRLERAARRAGLELRRFTSAAASPRAASIARRDSSTPAAAARAASAPARAATTRPAITAASIRLP